METLAAHGSNRVLFGLPGSEEEFTFGLQHGEIRRPMLCLQGTTAIGASAITNRNLRSLNLRLLCFFLHPDTALLPLAALVRHIFWVLPMHRIYVQLPLVRGATAYANLMRRAGFSDEGVVRAHARIGDRLYDVAALGILRREFEAWCLENEQRLAL